MSFQKKRIVVLTEREYLERLQLLLSTTTLAAGRLIVTGNSISEATLLSQDLTTELLTALDPIVDTDFTLELKEGILDLWVLSKFLSISLDVIME